MRKLPDKAVLSVKQVQACLSAREDRESNFHGSGSAVCLMQACSCAEKT